MSAECTVMTWNVENLFPVGNRFGPTSKAIYRRKMRYLARTIASVAPDVLALQEVGDPGCLHDLQSALGAPYGQAAISRFPDERGIRVALIARHPLTGITQLRRFPPGALARVPDPEGKLARAMGRGALQATTTIGGTPLRLMTVHLKSKLLSFPGGRRFPRDEDERARGAGFALMRRTAEAVAVRVHLDQIMQADSTPTVLMGDLNDEPAAVTTQLLQGPPDANPARPDKGDRVRLNNLADYLPTKHHYSRLFNHEPELIDHILISQELLRQLRQADSLVHDITSITEDVKSRRDATIPDHAPLIARIQLP